MKKKIKILSICGSPRKGNSETILLKLQQILGTKGMENEIILLRNKKISRCLGCVEYCNRSFKCHTQDDMSAIMDKMEQADAIIFVSPNYFNMPTGLLKDFMDRCSVLYTAGKVKQFKKKKALVFAVGTDIIKNINICLNNIADNFCGILGMQVVARKSFRTHSELKGNYNDIFENKLNKDVQKELEKMANKLYLSLKK